MPNPWGTLAGFSDRSIPGWQERLVAKVNATATESAMRRRRRPNPLRETQFHIYCSSAWAVLARKAAESRGMPMSAYARRAVGAFIAHDLGLPLEDVYRLTSYPRRFGEREFKNTSQPSTKPDDGAGYGDWHIQGLA